MRTVYVATEPHQTDRSSAFVAELWADDDGRVQIIIPVGSEADAEQVALNLEDQLLMVVRS